MPDQMVTFAREDIAPSWWANALMRFVSSAALNFRIDLLNDTTVRVPAGASDDLAAIAIDGRWRYVEANVDRAHPGGAAGTYPLFVTTRENDVRNVPAVGSDFTNYAFDLAFAAVGGTPPIVAGTVDRFRHVADAVWDGAKITRIIPVVEELSATTRAALAGTSGIPSATNHFVTDADARNADTRVPKGAAGGDLGGVYPAPTVVTINGRAVAAVVFTDDGRIPTQAENDALQGTAGAPGGANRYVTDADVRNADTRVPKGAAGGVLSGTYPNPGFTVDMATQAEMDTALAANAAADRARANHTGTQLAATISDLAAVVKAYRLDEFAPPTAARTMGGQKITGLGDGTAAGDAINLGQFNVGLGAKQDAASAATDAELTAHAALGETAHPIVERSTAGGFPTAGLVDGMIVVMQIATGLFWQFRYDAGGPRWAFIGGPPLVVKEDVAVSDDGFFGPVLTIPLKGDYQLEIGAKVWHSEAAAGKEYLNLRRTSDGAAVGTQQAGGGSGVDEFTMLSGVVIAAHSALKGATYNLNFQTDFGQGRNEHRWIRATPIFCSN